MPDPTTPNKGLTQPLIGGDDNIWGELLNTDLDLIDSALGGTLAKSISTNATLTGSEAKNAGFHFTGTLSSNTTITWPSFFGQAAIRNHTIGGFSIVCGISGGTAVTVLNGETVAIWSDGTDFVRLAATGGGVTVPNSGLTNSSVTISGHPLTLGGSLSLASGDVSGLAAVATSGSASDLGSGTLPNARLSAVPNAALANSSVTIGGHTVALGGSQTLAASDLTNGTIGSGAVLLAASYGPLDGTSSTKTTTYTVTNSDKRKTISLGGNTLFTATVPAASGFDSDFQVRLCNQDANRAKRLAISGYSSFLLWPNQSIIVQNVGNAWQLYPRQQRWKIPVSATFYADPSGDDTNDGLVSSAPFQNVLTAWNVIRDQTDGPATIQLTPGVSYGQIGELDGDKSGAFGRLIAIVGDPSLSNPPQITTPGATTAITLRDGAWAQFDGVQIGSSGSGSVGVAIEQKALADFSNCQWASMIGGFHILVQDGGDVNITGLQKIVGNAAAHWYASQGGKLLCGTVTINAAVPVNFSNAFVLGDMLARIVLQNPTFANSGNITGIRYVLVHGSFLSAGGVTVPGSAPGTTDGTSVAY